jgi:hypothetical protein
LEHASPSTAQEKSARAFGDSSLLDQLSRVADLLAAGVTCAGMMGLGDDKALITMGEVRLDGGKATSSIAPGSAIPGFRSSRHPLDGCLLCQQPKTE